MRRRFDRSAFEADPPAHCRPTRDHPSRAPPMWRSTFTEPADGREATGVAPGRGARVRIDQRTTPVTLRQGICSGIDQPGRVVAERAQREVGRCLRVVRRARRRRGGSRIGAHRGAECTSGPPRRPTRRPRFRPPPLASLARSTTTACDRTRRVGGRPGHGRNPGRLGRRRHQGRGAGRGQADARDFSSPPGHGK